MQSSWMYDEEWTEEEIEEEEESYLAWADAECDRRRAEGDF